MRLRLEARKIPRDYPKEIYLRPEQVFFDNVEGHPIAIKRLRYNNKLRNMMIAYEENDEGVDIITIHPVAEEKIVNRIMTGRWTKK